MLWYYSGLFHDYSGLFHNYSDYFMTIRNYFVTIQSYLGLFWRMPYLEYHLELGPGMQCASQAGQTHDSQVVLTNKAFRCDISYLSRGLGKPSMHIN